MANALLALATDLPQFAKGDNGKRHVDASDQLRPRLREVVVGRAGQQTSSFGSARATHPDRYPAHPQNNSAAFFREASFAHLRADSASAVLGDDTD
jgi:hypothetical protein